MTAEGMNLELTEHTIDSKELIYTISTLHNQ
jgi:hypothetical protein